MAKRPDRPNPGKRSKFLPGDHVTLRGSVTRVGEDDRGDEIVTVTIEGYPHLVTIPSDKAEKTSGDPQ